MSKISTVLCLFFTLLFAVITGLFIFVDNSTNSDETNKFLKIGDMANIEYLFNRLYTDNGILKLCVYVCDTDNSGGVF